MNTNPMVSVYMLTYNHEKYIREALDSILMQKTTYSYEVIIGDDASTDSTPQIIMEYAEKYPKIIKPVLREKNIGAEKNGVDLKRRLQGKYVACLEGDDSWASPNKLQMQVDFLEAHPEYNAVFSWVNIIDHKGNIRYYANGNHYMLFPKHVFTMLDFQLGRIPGQFGSGMYRNIYKTFDFDWEKIYHAVPGDQISSLLLSLDNKKIYVTHKRLSNYRYITSATTSHNYYSAINEMEDTNLYYYRFYNTLERNVKEIAKRNVNLRPRKFMYLVEMWKRYKETPSIINLKRMMVAIKEEPHPIRLIIDGVFMNKKYKNHYVTSDKEGN